VISQVRFFRPRVRLTEMLGQPGGVSVERALARAERNVASIRDRCLAALDDKIAAIVAIHTERTSPALEQCYELSNQIIAEAGFFGLDELSAVALSFCTLLSQADRAGLPGDAVKVHVDSMLALRQPAIAEVESLRAAVLAELRTLTARLAAQRA